MKYKSILLVLIGLFIVSPVELYAQDTPPENPGGFPHLVPTWRLCTASYDEDTGYLIVSFRQDIDLATLFIYKNGILVVSDNMTNIQAGSSTAYNLSLYGAGIFTAYIQIGAQTYTIFEEEIEE